MDTTECEGITNCLYGSEPFRMCVLLDPAFYDKIGRDANN